MNFTKSSAGGISRGVKSCSVCLHKINVRIESVSYIILSFEVNFVLCEFRIK